MLTIEEKIRQLEAIAKSGDELYADYEEHGLQDTHGARRTKSLIEEKRQEIAWLRELQERRKAPEIVRCKNCIYYDPPHVENNGVRYEYTEMPEEAFDVLGTGLVTTEYGINIGGRCCRDYNAGYDDDKRVYVPENNYCGRAERRTE